MDLKRNIDQCDLVFLDLETTGLDITAGEAICEIGALKVRGHSILAQYQKLINPKKSIPPETYLIHKISDEAVKEAPYFEEVMDELLEFLKGSVICIYNAEFDMGFINKELKHRDYPLLEQPVIDILTMARRSFTLPKYNLGAVAFFFNIAIKQRHRALEDASLAFKIFCKLQDGIREKGIETLEEYISLYGFRNRIFRAHEDAKVSLLQQAVERGEIVKIRYFSLSRTLREYQIKPINVALENNAFYLWCHNMEEKSFRINVNRILEVQIA